jgi:hypothetical protein
MERSGLNGSKHYQNSRIQSLLNFFLKKILICSCHSQVTNCDTLPNAAFDFCNKLAFTVRG